ncbi:MULTISPECIES: ArsR/SmtB family transcription factor [Actinoalloteichus]|uniref:ArsR/SmtB family transcription factor n=1 Tax=Actinoalloteichus TaxID=65496 RepID=UPI0012DFC051|nr:winged helix-turn-helix domain-containing protein [Actinoalloteichus caeruleus]
MIFEAEDVSRVLIDPRMGRLTEAALAMDMLGRAQGTPFAQWSSQVHRRMGLRARSVRTIVRTLSPLPELIQWLRQPSPRHEALLIDRGLDTHEAGSVVEEFWSVAVEPWWSTLLRGLETEGQARGRILASGGVDQLLSTLHARIRWQHPELVILDGTGEPLRLQGRGLRLVPSLFLHGRPPVVVDDGRSRPSLLFGAQSATEEVFADPTETSHLLNALKALMGRTRAEILRALTTTSTTGQLARQLGVSLAGVSQHAGVLRNAGLISTARERNTVLHSLTPLGEALVTDGLGYPSEITGARVSSGVPLLGSRGAMTS